MAGKRTGAQAYDGNVVQIAANSAHGTDDLRVRTSRVVIRLRQQWTADRRAVVVPQTLGTMNRGAVIKDAGFAVADLRYLMDAKETTSRFDRRQSRSPQGRHCKT